MRLTLTLFDPMAWSDPAVTREFEKAGGTIGRAADNDWVLADPRRHLSDRHCAIDWRDGQFFLTDTSESGVFLNEAPEPLGPGNSAILRQGDRIALGDYLISVAVADPAPVTASASTPAPGAPTVP